jgi:hypothetical protein
MEKESIAGSLILGLCIAIAGVSMGIGFYKGRALDRYVTVKGLAERDVNADLAIWPITFNVSENDLDALQKGIETDRETIQQFLLGAGFKEEDLSLSPPRIRDTESEMRGEGMAKSPYRYIAQATVTTRSRDVARVRKTMEESGKLVGMGVVLSEQVWENPTEFLFTGLNEIKPAMIEEATRNAREAAEQFAKDSQSRVGKIRNAFQGFFTIEDRDRNSPDLKKIRVVTTVEYYLVD